MLIKTLLSGLMLYGVFLKYRKFFHHMIDPLSLSLSRDSELFQYLLQLCQALKYESHLDCALARFLLERAWKNKCIGHYLFWHLRYQLSPTKTDPILLYINYLRAEMDVQEAGLKFGLMLETYLRGSVNHIPELRKQMDAIGKLRSISELLHSKAFRDRV